MLWSLRDHCSHAVSGSRSGLCRCVIAPGPGQVDHRGSGRGWRERWRRADRLDPERERHQPPELATVVVTSGDVLVEQSRSPTPARRSPGSASARARAPRGRTAELTAQPGGGRNREPALACRARCCAGRAAQRPAEQALLRRPRTLSLRGERQGEFGDHRVEIRHAGLQPVGHAHPVRLDEQIVRQVDAEVHVLQRASSGAPAVSANRRRHWRERVGAGLAPFRLSNSSALRRRRRSPSSRDGARAAAARPRATNRLAR